MLGVLAACSEAPKQPAPVTGRPGPIDAGPPPITDPRFDLALDGMACAGWRPFFYVTGRADRDMDGLEGNWEQRCIDGRVQTTFRPSTTHARDDCDDTDPTRRLAAWRDGDGDGFAARLTWEACVDDLPTGFTRSLLSVAIADCNDADPLIQEILFVDADGDGFGAKDAPRCSPFVPYNQPSPPGLTRDSTDCDDNDPRRHPGAMEQWNDGFDSDCNGKDQPLECTDNPRRCGCALLNTAPPAIDATCPAADLFVAAQVDCSGCVGYSVVVIGNRGTSTARGGFDLVLTGRNGPAETLSVSTDLGPGENVLPIVLPDAPLQVHIVTAAPECDASNNVATLNAKSVPCE